MADASPASPVVNVEDVPEVPFTHGTHFASYDRALTPSMRPRGGRLGVNLTRVPPGRTACPFHYHQLEDEVFYVLEGHGVLRYGDSLIPLRPGDCVSCPAGLQIGHQLANTGEVDLVYLAIGNREPQEVAGYPDTNKIMVRGLQQIGVLAKAEYFEGEPAEPRVFGLARVLGFRP